METLKKLRPDEEETYLLLLDSERSDSDKLDALYRYMGPRVKAMFKKRWPRVPESVMQDALVDAGCKAMKSIRTYDESKASLRSWFLAIVRNAATDTWRKETRGERQAAEKREKRSSPEFISFSVAAIAVLKELSPRQRAILTFDLEAWPGKADSHVLADHLHTSAGSIYTERGRMYELIERKTGRRRPGGGT